MTDAETGAHMRALRKRLRLSQDQVADRSGLTQGVISKMERGGSWQLANARQAAVGLGISLAELVDPDNARDAGAGAELGAVSPDSRLLVRTVEQMGPAAGIQLLLTRMRPIGD